MILILIGEQASMHDINYKTIRQKFCKNFSWLKIKHFYTFLPQTQIARNKKIPPKNAQLLLKSVLIKEIFHYNII